MVHAFTLNFILFKLNLISCDDDYIEEEQLILETFKNKFYNKSNTIVDIGSHRGTNAKLFHSNGWNVYAIEPCEEHFNYLKKYKDLNFQAFKIAINNSTNSSAPFYKTNESDGNYSLIKLSSNHNDVEYIETKTLSNFVSENGINDIDYLKIDTEGCDLNVLQSYDWNDNNHPYFIMCEYEETNLNKFGSSNHSLWNYLSELNYHILISEWYPIKRYGIVHKWKRFTYNLNSIDDNSWGNYLCCKDLDFLKQIHE